MSDTKTKFTFDVVLAVEMDETAITLLFNSEPIVEPNGRTYYVLEEARASTVLPSDTHVDEAAKKAIATAAYFFKEKNPDWKDAAIRGLSPQVVRRTVVR